VARRVFSQIKQIIPNTDGTQKLQMYPYNFFFKQRFMVFSQTVQKQRFQIRAPPLVMPVSLANIKQKDGEDVH
jgi:hypothetical protein